MILRATIDIVGGLSTPSVLEAACGKVLEEQECVHNALDRNVLTT
jgi:hypothetical protein